MKLTFFGAAHAVTGSCHCVECGGKKILVDCGLQQGRDEKDNQALDFNAGYIDAVVVTHAHIDHSGRIPLLVKQGFAGNIYCTRLTGQLLSIMLRDSAHIQESDAQWANQKGRRAGEEPVEPLYTVADAREAVRHVVTCEYGTTLQIADGVKIPFVGAGHLLGSSSVEMWLTEGGETRKVVFSGDIGNRDQPIIRDPQYIGDADYVLTESTYGDRLHDMSQKPDYTADLAAIIDETLGQGGNVIIPSFAVGRTQELLYFIREIKEKRLLSEYQDFEVYLDSPLAIEATKVFTKNMRDCFDEEALALVNAGVNPLVFPGLHTSTTSDDSKMINFIEKPKVIISASGMCDAGRIRHHLKHNLWRPECTILFVGYQAAGTLGRRLLEGEKNVKLFGEPIEVHARIESLHGVSGHADMNGLLNWIGGFRTPIERVFVVHGEDTVTEEFARTVEERFGYKAWAPFPGCEADLLSNEIVNEGVRIPVKAKKAAQRRADTAFDRLVEAGKRLLDIIYSNEGLSNKDKAKFESQINNLADKWEM